MRFPPGLIVNQVAGAAVADWNVDRRTLTVSFLEPIASQVSVVVTGEMRAPREGHITIPLVRVPAAERETGGVAVDVVGAGEIAERQPRGLEPADPPTSATSSLAASRRRWSRSGSRRWPAAAPRSLSLHRDALRRAGGARRQRRGGALRRAARRRRQAARAGALRRPQQPAQLPCGDAAAGVHAVERVAGRPSDASRAVAQWRTAAAASQRTRRAKRPRPSSSSSLYLQRGPAWTEKGTRASCCRPSICRCHAPA